VEKSNVGVGESRPNLFHEMLTGDSEEEHRKKEPGEVGFARGTNLTNPCDVAFSGVFPWLLTVGGAAGGEERKGV